MVSVTTSLSAKLTRRLEEHCCTGDSGAAKSKDMLAGLLAVGIAR
jgi:hypothetical protein